MPATSTTTCRLVVIDRIKDLAETARAERFSPHRSENKLKFLAYIPKRWACAGPRCAAAISGIALLDHLEWAEKTGSRSPTNRPCLAPEV